MLTTEPITRRTHIRTLGSFVSRKTATDCSAEDDENPQSVQILWAASVMPKDDFAARLNQALDDLEWPKRGRASKLRGMLPFDMSEKGIKKWLDGESRPEQDKLAAICAITGCLGEWLLTGLGPKRQGEASESYDTISIPITQAWTPTANSMEVMADPCDQGVVYLPRISHQDYAAVITTSGLLPRIERGQVAVVAPTLPVLEGDMVLITLASGELLLCRWLYDRDGVRYIEPVNGGDRRELLHSEVASCHYVAQVLNRRRSAKP